jgi:hypothetical protein
VKVATGLKLVSALFSGQSGGRELKTKTCLATLITKICFWKKSVHQLRTKTRCTPVSKLNPDLLGTILSHKKVPATQSFPQIRLIPRWKLSGGQEVRTNNDFLSKHAPDLQPFKAVQQNKQICVAECSNQRKKY